MFKKKKNWVWQLVVLNFSNNLCIGNDMQWQIA